MKKISIDVLIEDDAVLGGELSLVWLLDKIISNLSKTESQGSQVLRLDGCDVQISVINVEA